MKKFISFLTVLCMTMALCIPCVGAIGDGPSMTKAEFAEYCNNICSDGDQVSAHSDDDKDRLLVQYVINTDAKERAELEKQLNKAGVFIYSDGSENMVAPLSSPSDVTLSNVICSYDYDSGDWSLVAGGHWNNHTAILKDITSLPSLGTRKDIGGLDAVGVAIGYTSGTLPPLKSSFGTVYDEQGNTTELKNPATSTTAKGIVFQYQDFITTGANGSFNHMGNGFACVMRFGPEFVNWNGYARSSYYHTWGNTTIDSFGFNIGEKEFGFNVSWSAKKDCFEAYSNGDTKF